MSGLNPKSFSLFFAILAQVVVTTDSVAAQRPASVEVQLIALIGFDDPVGVEAGAQREHERLGIDVLVGGWGAELLEAEAGERREPPFRVAGRSRSARREDAA